MIRRVLGRRRPAFAGLLVIALVALAFGVAQALAGTGTATAPIQKYNTTCGHDLGTSPIGSVTFTRDDKTTLRTHLRLTKFSPSTKYGVWLYHGSDASCSILTVLGSLKTDSSGAGEATFTSSTYGRQSFFILAYPINPYGVGVWGISVSVKVDG